MSFTPITNDNKLKSNSRTNKPIFFMRKLHFYLIENAQHELYIEKDEIIQSYFNQMKEFIETKILK